MKNIIIISGMSILFALGACDSNKTTEVQQVAEAVTEAKPVSTPVESTVQAKSVAAAPATSPEPSEYQVDVEGAHAFINAKFMHLGYSVLWATFKEFDGSFMYDADNIENSSITININVASIDSNHAKRDEHMRSAKYLNTETYPDASFVSTGITEARNGMLKVSGDLTLHGITRNISFDAKKLGEGDDPWGGYRVGFEGKYSLTMSDFGMTSFRPDQVDLELYLEGIKKK